ncbi:hypothetical protein [Hoeflea sp. TYP-13]|uniref:hypothetical protein n=1 Tax=Hoeflea sp. TYP-13 TaxID=3230023 RepID=UPI0034C6033C
MRKTTPIIILSGLLALTILPAGAGAEGQRKCESFSVTGPFSTAITEFADIDANGKASTGDKQLGQIRLHNDKDDQMGERSWVMTVLDLADDGSLKSAFTESISSFYDGAIYTVTKVRDMPANSFEDGQLAIEWSEYTSPIIGGTGAYAGARGTVTAVLGDGKIDYSFDLECD